MINFEYAGSKCQLIAIPMKNSITHYQLTNSMGSIMFDKVSKDQFLYYEGKIVFTMSYEFSSLFLEAFNSL